MKAWACTCSYLYAQLVLFCAIFTITEKFLFFFLLILIVSCSFILVIYFLNLEEYNILPYSILVCSYSMTFIYFIFCSASFLVVFSLFFLGGKKHVFLFLFNIFVPFLCCTNYKSIEKTCAIIILCFLFIYIVPPLLPLFFEF